MKQFLPLQISWIFCFFISSSLQQDNDESLCSTPRNEIGTCIGIRQCRYLYDLLEREKNNPRAVQYVRNSHCGVEGRLPKVCCPQYTLTLSQQVPATTTTARTFPQNNRNGAFSKLPSAERGECGVNAFDSSKRIVGGTPSEKGQWPWMTAIGFKLRNRRPRTPEWMCGGVLISNRYVLTAAHCVSKATTGEYEPYVVQVGNIDLNDTSAGLILEIETQIIHNGYSAQTKLNDIALFRLKEDVPLSNFIQPICLPFEDRLRSELFLRKSPFVAGWGSTVFRGPLSPKLRHVQISVVDNPTCRNIFTNYGATIDENILCAGVLAGGKDSCGGDSGGPLMLPLDKKYYIIGVVSYGKKCAEVGFPGVYTRVTNYVQWISDNIR